MGSFAISALGSRGAAIVDTIPVWSSFLNYGPIAPDGGVDVYLSVDHRVIDGGLAARAIRALEATLNGLVLDELRALADPSSFLDKYADADCTLSTGNKETLMTAIKGGELPPAERFVCKKPMQVEK